MLAKRILICLCILSFTGNITMAQNQTASFDQFHQRALAGEKLNVVFLGGSLTWGANASDPNQTSYRALMGKYLIEKYPKAHITNHDAAIGGTGSVLGTFRIQRDVFAHNPDLIFLDFTINDGITSANDWKLDTYESLLQHFIGKGIPVVQAMLSCYGQLGKKFNLEKTKRYTAHQQLSKVYHTGVGDTMNYIQNLWKQKKIDLDKLWCIGTDKTHPGDAGYRLYFEAVKEGYEQAVAQKRVCVLLPKPLFGNSFMQSTRQILVDMKNIPAGWKRQKNYRTSLWFDGLSSRWMTDTLVADIKDRKTVKPLEVEFQGTLVGIFGEMDADAVPFRVWIDGKPVLNNGSEYWEKNTARFGGSRLFFWQVFKHDLAPGSHTLKIQPLFLNSDKKGDLRIESICSAG